MMKGQQGEVEVGEVQQLTGAVNWLPGSGGEFYVLTGLSLLVFVDRIFCSLALTFVGRGVDDFSRR